MVRKRKVIALDETGVEVPAKLVSDIKAAWATLSSVRVNARRGRKGYQPLQVVALERSEELEGLGISGAEETPISVARDAYAIAQAEAEDTGGGFFRFQGLADDPDAGGAVVLFERSLKVEVDAEGEAEEVHDDPTASILAACAASVDRFGTLVARAVEMNLRTQEQTAGQLADLRAQIFEQAHAMRGMDETRLRAQRDALEHEASLARTAALAESLSAGVSMLVPQLAQVLADRAQPAPPPPEENPPAPGPQGPVARCSEAGALFRCLERLEPGVRESFLAQFSAEQREIIQQAQSCAHQTEFDGLVSELFVLSGATEREDALPLAQRWVELLPPEARIILAPQMLSVSNRLRWPLEAAPCEPIADATNTEQG